MSLVEQVKSNKAYYLAMKISVISIVSGLVCFLLIWVGIWTQIDEIRYGGMIFFAASIAIAVCSYCFSLVYLAYFVLKKTINATKSK